MAGFYEVAILDLDVEMLTQHLDGHLLRVPLSLGCAWRERPAAQVNTGLMGYISLQICMFR